MTVNLINNIKNWYKNISLIMEQSDKKYTIPSSLCDFNKIEVYD